MSHCKINFNNGVASVHNADGSPSPLFKEALEFFENQEDALNTVRIANSEWFSNEVGIHPEKATVKDVLRAVDMQGFENLKLTAEELNEVASLMEEQGIETLQELSDKLESLFKPKGVFEISPKRLLKSGMYTQQEIDEMDADQMLNVVNKITATALNENLTIGSATVQLFNIRKTEGSKNLLGRYKNISSNDIIEFAIKNTKENSLEGLVEVFSNSSEFESVAEQISSNKNTLKVLQDHLTRYQAVPKVEVTNEGIKPKTTSTKETVVNTVPFDANTRSITAYLDSLSDISESVWNKNLDKVRSILNKIEDRFVELNVDVIGVSKLSNRNDVLDLLESAEAMLKNPTEATIDVFTEVKDRVIPTQDSSRIIERDPKLEGLNVVALETELTPGELFDNFGLVKVGEGLYHVTDLNKEEAYEELYTRFLEGSFMIPLSMQTAENMSDPLNKEVVIENIKNVIRSKDVGFEVNDREGVALAQELFEYPPQKTHNPPAEIKNQSKLTSEFISKFYNYILRAKQKGSEVYDKVLKYFKVTNSDLILEAGTHVPNIEGIQYEEDLRDYAQLKREGEIKKIAPNDRPLEVSKDYDTKVLNNPKLIPEIQGKFIESGKYIVTPISSDLYKRVGNNLYRKVASDINGSIFEKVSTYQDPVYFDTNVNFSTNVNEAKNVLKQYAKTLPKLEQVSTDNIKKSVDIDNKVPADLVESTERQKKLEAVVNQLNKTGLATKVHMMSSKQIEDKLRELGVDAKLTKQVADYVKGYYSNANVAFSNLKDKNVKNVQGWIKALTDVQKNGGIKNVNQELKWIGLEDYLNEYVKENNPKNGNIPASVVEDYIKLNQIEIVEVSKGKPEIDINDIEAEFDGSGFVISYSGEGNLIMPYITLDQINLSEEDTYEEDFDYYSAQEAAKEVAIAEVLDREDGEVKYSGYQLKGGENYREVLLTMPSKEGKNPLHVKRDELSRQYREAFDSGNYELANEIDNQISDVTKQLIAENSINTTGEKAQYESSHWDEANVLAHVRLNEKTLPDGRRVLIVNEVQSDWAQDGRKEGFINKELQRKSNIASTKYKALQEELTKIKEEKKSEKDDYQRVLYNDGKGYTTNVDEYGNVTIGKSVNNFGKQLGDSTGVEAVKEEGGNYRIYVDGQVIRKNNYYGSKDVAERTIEELKNRVDAERSHEETVEIESLPSIEQEAIRVIQDYYSKVVPLERQIIAVRRDIIEQSGVQPMPYENTDQWAGLVIRRVMQMASQEGYDGIAFATGQQSADMYSLAKQVDNISWDTSDNTLTAFDKNGKQQFQQSNVTDEKLENFVGKEVAEKLIKRKESLTEEDEGVVNLENADLEVGGEGMKTFYDKIIPKVVQKEAQRFDKNAKLETVDFSDNFTFSKKELDDYTNYLLNKYNLDKTGRHRVLIERNATTEEVAKYKNLLENFRKDNDSKTSQGDKLSLGVQPYLPLTNSIKDSVSQSIPQFQKNGITPTTYGFVHNGEVYLNKDVADASTAVHEFNHLYTSLLKDVNPDLYKKGLSLIETQGKEYIEFVKKNQPNLEGEALLEEALTQAVGESGARIIDQKSRNSFTEFLKELWDSIKNMLGLSSYTMDQVNNMTLEEYTNAMATDLLRGESLGDNIESVSNKLEELQTLELEDDQVRYPKYIEEDVTDIADLGDGYYLQINNKESLPEAGSFEIFITDYNNDVLGFIRGNKNETTITFNLIHLKEDSRGQGIGKNIYKYFLNSYNIKSDSEITADTEMLYNSLLKDGYRGIITTDNRVEILSNNSKFQTNAIEPELQQIKDEAIANGTFMKAPNGKDTNLNERQWLQVRTKSFKENFFGDWQNDPENASKVVDENGEPMVVFHGTNGEFTTFDPKMIGINANAEGAGFYFTDDKAVAEGYMNTNKDNPSLYEVFLNVRNPIYYGDKMFKKGDVRKIIKQVIKNEIDFDPEGVKDYKDSFMSNFVNTYSIKEDRAIEEVVNILMDDETKIDFISGLGNAVGSQSMVLDAVNKALGYDSTFAKGYSGEGEAGGNIYITWSPNQIKSATDNVGTFSSETNNIKYQQAIKNNVLKMPVEDVNEFVRDLESSNLNEAVTKLTENLSNIDKVSDPFIKERVESILIDSPSTRLDTPALDFLKQESTIKTYQTTKNSNIVVNKLYGESENINEKFENCSF